ncbi:hypothetical protein [Bdellovibrio sp. HCB-162]|uniref:hypothetical protein n=1 Tax=Bdellovibrio sp. HCB-162 TaxID=3394234 RepID=UPI0039BD1F19
MNTLIGSLLLAMFLTPKAEAADSVELISRYNGGNYVTATYSFKYMTRDNVELTRNNWEILFEAREDFADHFRVNTVVDDFSFIFDLGEKSCKEINSKYPDEKATRPLVWLAYTDVDPYDLPPTREALVKENHCYLSYNNDSEGTVVTLFHVKSHVKSKSVVLDEIDVLLGSASSPTASLK